MELYDKKGKPIAYIENNEDIYLFTGEPVAYIYNNEIFGFNGFHIGWFENGWMRDLDGRYVLYTRNAYGGPIKPVVKVAPIKKIKKIKPIKKIKKLSKIKKTSLFSWSNLEGKEFLKNGIKY